MGLTIRQEEEKDYKDIQDLVQEAFQGMPHSDQKEHLLIAHLRSSDAYLPDLALVAEWEGEVVGHILLTRIYVQKGEDSTPGLALAPIAVSPPFQNRGIGGKLIQAAHELAKRSGESFIVLIGHEQYYPRFGYREAKPFGITFPFDVPSPNAMVCFLDAESIKIVKGTVAYPPEFFAD